MSHNTGFKVKFEGQFFHTFKPTDDGKAVAIFATESMAVVFDKREHAENAVGAIGWFKKNPSAMAKVEIVPA